MIFFFTLLFWSFSLFAVKAESFVLDFDIDKELRRNLKKPATSHPDYPAYPIIEHITDKSAGSPQERINKFEKILTDDQFKVLVDKGSQSELKLKVGAKGSFSLWRDLLYLILGRAYYEKEDMAKASDYFAFIQNESPYYLIARLHYHYALFANEKWEKAEQSIEKLQERKSPFAHLRNEVLVQKAYVLNRKQEYKKSINLIEKLTFPKITTSMFHKKVLAEAYFGYYIQESNAMSFEAKLEHLKKLTTLVDSIPGSFRDGNLSYLAAESYWHTAVAYRLEDPVKYEKIWHKQLEIADNWISPFVEKSINKERAYLSEEAFFFSIAILWEREKQSLGLKRLKSLPKLYPQGIYREDSYQLLGDYYFETQDFKSAVYYYRRLADIGVESKAAYGVYKAAWSFYNDKNKWKALRHFERLFDHYQQMDQKERDEKSELSKESRQDFLLVASEILKAPKGIAELDIFKLKADEKIGMISDLAKSYQSIGSFTDAIYTWEYLLNHHLKEKNSHEWLVELMKDYQSTGKRKTITETMKKYFPKWEKVQLENKVGREQIFEEWTKIILYVHKEARKTDDPAYWEATHFAYDTYEELNPNGINADVWFYGAQKFERAGKIWKSIDWYKKAALIPGFKQQDDAALTILTLVTQQSEELSILEDKKKHENDYKKVREYSQWFFQKAPEKLDKQKELSRLLYVEANHYLKNFEENKLFLKEQFEKSFDETKWNLFLSANQRFYHEEKWALSYDLTTFLWESRGNLNQEQKSTLLNLRQETSFQLAYVNEQKKENKDIKEVRHWYRNTFSFKEANRFSSLKAWHNYLLTYKANEIEDFEKNLKEFQSDWSEAKSLEEKQLYFNIYSKAFNLFDEAKLYYKKSLYLPIASNYSDDMSTKESMGWEALVLSAAYYQWDHFDDILTFLQTQKSSYLNKEGNQIFLSKAYFYRKDFEKSWELTQKLIGEQTQVAAWTLLIDNLRFAGSSVRSEIREYLKKNEKAFEKVDLLKPIWGELMKEEYMDKVSDLLDMDYERKPASIGEDDVKIVKQLKEKLADVANTMGEMNFKKEKLSSALIKNIPQTGLDIACKGPLLTDEALKNLDDIKNDPIDSPQWAQFVAKIDEKVSELNSLKENEMKTCEKLKNELVYFGQFKKMYTPFCDEEDCLFDNNPDLGDILSLEEKWHKSGKQDSFEKFLHFLKAGAFTQAEFLAAQETNQEQQVFMFGLIRLALSDYWSTFAIMQTFKNEPKWKNSSEYILAIMAQAQDNEAVVKKHPYKAQEKINLIENYLKK